MRWRAAFGLAFCSVLYGCGSRVVVKPTTEAVLRECREGDFIEVKVWRTLIGLHYVRLTDDGWIEGKAVRVPLANASGISILKKSQSQQGN